MYYVEPFEVLYNYVEQLHPLSSLDKDLCRKYMLICKAPKESIISRDGEIPRFHYFIASGHVRKYTIDQSYNEITLDINDSPRWMSSYEYFINRTISDETLECLTDCVLLRLSRDHFQILSEEGDNFNAYVILLFQEIILAEKKRMLSLSSLDAEERYVKLMNDKPNIYKNVPLKHIASYLRIRPQSLSRIRRALLNTG